MAEYTYCTGCGKRVELPEPRTDNPTVLREQGYSSAPGRATVRYGGVVLHRCADGAYLPPGQNAAPREPRG